MTRKIVFDVETTGLSPDEDHRVLEIGCVEIDDEGKVQKEWQCYFNPEREIGEDATQIHGITNEMVARQPKFAEKCEEFLQFIHGAKLIAHNAEFDRSFINKEISNIDESKQLPRSRFIDTLPLAKRKFPTGRVDLSTLCDRLYIEKNREKHGALLDAKLLAQVYVKLCPWKEELTLQKRYTAFSYNRDLPHEGAVIPPSTQEKREHQKYLAEIPDNLWTS